MHEVRQQRQCEEAVGDGSAERGFTLRALGVNVDPLVVERGVSELLYAVLGHGEPIAHGNLLAGEFLQRIRRSHCAFGHGWLLSSISWSPFPGECSRFLTSISCAALSSESCRYQSWAGHP